MSAKLQIDYEPGGPLRRRKAWRRWGVSLALVALVATVWFEGPAAYRKVLRAYWEHRVANYVAPADRVVYEEDPARWPALLAQPGYCKILAGSPGFSPFVAYLAEPVNQLYHVCNLSTGATALFAHSRRTPDGRELLVDVWTSYDGARNTANGALPDNQMWLELADTVVDGAKVTVHLEALKIAMQPIADHPHVPLYARFYAGQVDPTDATHFTIPYQIGDYSDLLDGYLRNDNSVLLCPRKYDDLLNPKRPLGVRPGD